MKGKVNNVKNKFFTWRFVSVRCLTQSRFMRRMEDIMKKSKTNVFRILSVILMLVMVVSAVNGNTVSAKTAKAKTDKKKNGKKASRKQKPRRKNKKGRK